LRLPARPGARVIHQHPPHHLRRGGEEVGAVLPVLLVMRDEAQVGLVDQCRWLEDMSGSFASQLRAGQPPQVGVDKVGGAVPDMSIGGAELPQQLRDRA
jgi:hypothetical protein